MIDIQLSSLQHKVDRFFADKATTPLHLMESFD
jgi:hypothetical protein